MNANRKYQIAIGILALILLIIGGIFAYNQIMKRGKVWGKIELIDKMINDKKIPTGYIYCPYAISFIENQNITGSQADDIIDFCRRNKFTVTWGSG